MRTLRSWSSRLACVLRGRRLNRELGDELESHLQMHIDDNQRRGMTPDQARRDAMIRLGGLEQVKDAYRDRQGVPLLETTLSDLRFTARLVRRSPGFAFVILLTLAIGIGANTVMFSIVNTLLLRPLPYREPDRLMSVQTVDGVRRRQLPAAPPDFYTFREQNRSFDGLEAYYFGSYNLTGGSAPERLPALIVSSGFLDTLGTPTALGRGFIKQDEEWGAHRVAILTHGLWQTHFAGDPAVVGRSITLNAQPFVVIGVLPRGFSFLGRDVQLFVPMAFEPGDHMNSHSNHFLRIFGRLRPGVSRDQASADLTSIGRTIAAEQSVNPGTVLDLIGLHDLLVGGDVRTSLLVLLGAVGFVLLISCANLANLLLARAAVRQREVAVRAALGASRGRLVRQFLAESVALSLAGGCLGLAAAYASADTLNLISQQVLPRASAIRIDPRVLAFTFLVATATGILLGLAPAWHSLTGDLNAGLKEGARGQSDAGGRGWLRTTLLLAEIALSLILLVGAGLMVKSMYRLLHVDSGFDPTGVLTMQINLPAQKYVDAKLEKEFSPAAYSRAVGFFAEAIDRARRIPGARAVGAINGLPLMGEIWGKNITFYDRPFPPDVSGLSPIQYRVVYGDYFRALGIRILNGRAFSDADTGTSPKVAIVNQELVRRSWNGQSPLGKIISVNPPLQLLPKAVIEEARRAGNLPADYAPDKFTVVGVADDVLYAGLEKSPLPLVYVPYSQGSEGTTSMLLAVRGDGDPLALTGLIREQLAQIDPELPLADVRTMEARLAASVAQRRMQMNVLGAFAAMAILLAAIGIYGVMSYWVAQRSREIGIRLALGAARSDVTGLILIQGLKIAMAGVVFGLVGALLVTRALQSLLFDVSVTDPAVFVTIVIVLSGTACLATYLPARRAARLDPLITLRSE